MFFEPNETPFDLRWRMFGIYVRVHPLFWLLSAMLGWGYMREGFPALLSWIACTFISILVHEMGHVLMGRLFGADGYIILYSFGGLAVGSNQLDRRWQRIAVSLAGPFAQFLLLGVIFLFLFSGAANMDDWPPLAEIAVDQLFRINLFWPIFNLLPIWPLDGGMVSREISQGVSPRKGTQFSLGMSIAIAGFLAVNTLAATKGKPLVPFLHLYGMYAVFFFAFLAFNSWQMLQFEQQKHQTWDEVEESEFWGR